MACALHPGAALEGAGPADGLLARPVAPHMTGCECAGLSFVEVARQMAADGASLDEVGRRTGCGQTCTACLPDLRRFLSSR